MREVINIYDRILGVSHRTVYNTSNYKIIQLFQELKVWESGELLLEFKKPGSAKITDSWYQHFQMPTTQKWAILSKILSVLWALPNA